ncbi:hypothetical protein QBC33DRAFT_621450 [Phialemonium atrogriseum]|uniref:Thiamine pyrophosphate enzyme TPP-binding domain-containing protein n=1 Tax=Phialemonium atrogriseum TaxID=1093897 RepID=A0AAJ0FE50_9PEZI|nr:uncharacterized protein QBC33DRAFT_621450 [Phialemonium atrogriseum]KAK1765251.1 hypothetical protein QBC33DRAFT_621450 [Phialemonium atrogriseum]
MLHLNASVSASASTLTFQTPPQFHLSTLAELDLTAELRQPTDLDNLRLMRVGDPLDRFRSIQRAVVDGALFVSHCWSKLLDLRTGLFAWCSQGHGSGTCEASAIRRGYGSGAAGASASITDGKRVISVMVDGGFWHNGLTSGIGKAVFNQDDLVTLIVNNGYSAATGGHDYPLVACRQSLPQHKEFD